MDYTIGLGIIIFVIGVIVIFCGDRVNPSRVPPRSSYEPDDMFNSIDWDDDYE